MSAARPVSAYDVAPAGSTVTGTNAEQPAPEHRSTANPVSSVDASVHVSATELAEVACAVRFVGGAGGGGGGGASPSAPMTAAWNVPVLPDEDSTRSVQVPDPALAVLSVSDRPAPAQLPLVALSMQRLDATTVPAGLTR